jgi:hypothetical protein
MAESDEARVNGNVVSWSSIVWKIDGVRYYGFTQIGWDESRERALAYGQNRAHKPIGRSAGKYTPSPVKITVHAHTAKKIKQQFAEADGSNSFGNAGLPMTLGIAEGQRSGLFEFEDCAFVKSTPAFEEKVEGQMEEIELSTMGIVTDGLTLYDSTAQ